MWIPGEGGGKGGSKPEPPNFFSPFFFSYPFGGYIYMDMDINVRMYFGKFAWGGGRGGGVGGGMGRMDGWRGGGGGGVWKPTLNQEIEMEKHVLRPCVRGGREGGGGR